MPTLATSPDADVSVWPMIIDGRDAYAADGALTEITSPSRPGLVLATVPRGQERDVDLAVEAALAAQPGWAASHFTVRQRALLAAADLIEENAEELARLTAHDTGNALRPQARPEVASLVALFRYFAGLAGEFKGTVLPAGDGQLQYTRIEPLGVVGAILPWNSPLMIAGMKLPAALAVGNALVVKPADEAPLTILRLGQLLNTVLPPGVLNIVTGPGPTVGGAIVRHPGIHKVSFTGSTAVGREVARVAGERLAHVSLELGGKSPSIVFPSAATPERLTDTVRGLLLGMRFTRQGQSCTAGSRLLVHRSVYESVLTELKTQAAELVVGDPLDEATDMGAIISTKQFQRIVDYVHSAKDDGVDVVLDGTGLVEDTETGGLFQGPTILAGVDNASRIAQEEVFGPVLVAMPFDSLEEAVAIANDSPYGLAAYVWSHDLDEALTAAARIESGWVQVNQGGGQVVGQSYGGYKDSGVGREFSLEGAIAAFSQIKQVNVRVGVG
ncbi:Betaine-aldehyde dehydrogenase [Nostocoides japonicum T1-X7]|uniref:Betaine-aldehyde dehydrogenase n=1 Tax=Nostocoides japonicum T1-X7 TaxID=1194083 RepID=A0A077LT31_9MICO|nr:aldehyde dehydrogenase family protein [Tetrasphaera japonica]CCH76101.1 Betaine-aldehyde dehydrogenase [Tetrasphaera japonica T1-X7]